MPHRRPGSLTRDTVTGIVWRRLDKVRVRGKMLAERIYEPLGREGEISAADLILLVRWHDALLDFRRRRWNRAKATFEQLGREARLLAPATSTWADVRTLLLNPPGDDWDASFTLYDK